MRLIVWIRANVLAPDLVESESVEPGALRLCQGDTSGRGFVDESLTASHLNRASCEELSSLGSPGGATIIGSEPGPEGCCENECSMERRCDHCHRPSRAFTRSRSEPKGEFDEGEKQDERRED